MGECCLLLRGGESGTSSPDSDLPLSSATAAALIFSFKSLVFPAAAPFAFAVVLAVVLAVSVSVTLAVPFAVLAVSVSVTLAAAFAFAVLAVALVRQILAVKTFTELFHCGLAYRNNLSCKVKNLSGHRMVEVHGNTVFGDFGNGSLDNLPVAIKHRDYCSYVKKIFAQFAVNFK